MGVTMATNFCTKIATDSENVITYNGVFVVGQSKEDISGCRGLRDIAMATNFWPK